MRISVRGLWGTACLAALLTLAACGGRARTVATIPSEPIATAPAQVEPRRPAQAVSLALVPTQHDRVTAAGGGAVILLRSRPRSSYENLVACASLKRLAAARAPEGAEPARPVSWLSTTDSDAALPTNGCEKAVQAYDYDRADMVRKKYGIRGSGPQLVIARNDEAQAVVVDLSNRSVEDIDRWIRVFGLGLAGADAAWDPGALSPEKRRALIEAGFGGAYRAALLGDISFVTSPKGCSTGNLSDQPC